MVVEIQYLLRLARSCGSDRSARAVPNLASNCFGQRALRRSATNAGRQSQLKEFPA
jgi:hypothetical protein